MGRCPDAEVKHWFMGSMSNIWFIIPYDADYERTKIGCSMHQIKAVVPVK